MSINLLLMYIQNGKMLWDRSYIHIKLNRPFQAFFFMIDLVYICCFTVSFVETAFFYLILHRNENICCI